MSKLTKNYEVNDIVAVFGGYVAKDEKIADHITICKVKICGQEDLIVEELENKSFVTGPNFFTVSKKLCVKLDLNPDHLGNCEKLRASIGDLVLYYSRDKFSKEEPEKITGIVYKVLYKFGGPYKATVLSGDEFMDLPFDKLLVLQRNSNP